jgi:tetratricopeptide (TPR) repeat protein
VSRAPFTFALSALLCLSTPLAAADVAAGLNQGSALEADGRLDDAALLYEALLGGNPDRADVLLRLESVYARLGRHGDGAALLQTWLARHPRDVTARMRLGSSFLAQGRKEDAIAAWDELLRGEKGPALYQMVGEHCERSGLDANAETVYRRGRRAAGQPDLFAREIAQIAERTGRYADAVREYLLLSDVRPQYAPLVESRLKEAAADEPSRQAVFGLLSDPSRLKDPGRLRFLVTYAAGAGMGAQALAAVAALPWDSAVEQAAVRLADLGATSGDPLLASRAGALLLQQSEDPGLRAQAGICLARAEEALGRPGEAEAHYKAVLADRRYVPLADEAAVNLGRLLARRGDVEGAVALWDSVVQRGAATPFRYEALFALADAHVVAGRLDLAASAYAKVRSEEAGAERADEAVLQEALLLFYQERFEEAQKAMAPILEGALLSGAANDAIDLSELLREGAEADPATLARLARAERRRREGRLEAALDTLSAAAADRPASPLGARIHRARVQILSALSRHGEAAAACEDLLRIAPDGPFAPWARFALGDLLETRLGRAGAAAAEFERLLNDFPSSVEADLARERLRAMRDRGPDQDRRQPG